jgi:hypothetical protein
VKCYEFLLAFLADHGFQGTPRGFGEDAVDYDRPYVAVEEGKFHLIDIYILDADGNCVDDGSIIMLNIPGVASSYGEINLAYPTSLASLLKQLRLVSQAARIFAENTLSHHGALSSILSKGRHA